jgi:hypothetical protein
MIWITRTFEGADYLPWRGRVLALLADSPAFAREFIMISVACSDSQASDFYIGLPNRWYLVHFQDFDIVAENDLPKRIDGIHAADPACEKLGLFKLAGPPD